MRVMSALLTLWTLTKDGRSTSLTVHLHRHGHELRASVDGTALWSQVFASGDGVNLRQVADKHRAAWLALGWRPQAAPPGTTDT